MPEMTLPPAERARLREFLSDSHLAPVLEAMRERWVKNGRVGGTIPLLSKADAAALGAITGRSYRAGGRVSLRQVEGDLQTRTRFKCTLREALEVHFDTTLTSNPERRQAQEAAWGETLEALQTEIAEAALREDVRARIGAWIVDKAPEFRRRHTRDRARLLKEFAAVVRAVERLPEGDDTVALAVLAHEATGDAHAFDVRSPISSLFDRALAWLHPEVEDALQRGAEGRDELLTAAGVAKDRTSARVDAFGLWSVDSRFGYLEAVPLQTFSLRALELMPRGHLRAARGTVFVVENAAVFDQLVERLLPLEGVARPTVLCTNGRLNLADRRLLGELARVGTQIRYSGDFDLDGLSIAAEVLRRFDPQAKLWRMSPEDYRAAVQSRSPELPEAPMPEAPELDPALMAAMAACGRAAYQEALLDLIEADVLDDEFGAEPS